MHPRLLSLRQFKAVEAFQNIDFEQSTYVYINLCVDEGPRQPARGWVSGRSDCANLGSEQGRLLPSGAGTYFLEMLKHGRFGAIARGVVMLGEPVVCYVRPKWIERARQEKFYDVDEFLILNTKPQTAETVLCDFMDNETKRFKIGRRSREFIVKRHSSEAGALPPDHIHRELLG
jgi:hypothetical protein